MEYYDGVRLERSNPRLKDVLTKLAFDDQVWQSRNFQQWKCEIAIWLLENFGDADKLAREQLIVRLSEETAPIFKKLALQLILTHYAHLDNSLSDNLLTSFDGSNLFLDSDEANELVCLTEQLPTNLRTKVVKMIMAGPIMPGPIMAGPIMPGPIMAGPTEACMTFPPIPDNTVLLREWWHRILRQYDHYPSYAMMLALPADTEAVRYQKEFGKELHLITGNACLVITLTGLGFMQYGSDDKIMPLAIDESVAEGYCLKVAELFNIKFNQFPCLILFRDIRKTEHILVTLKGLDAEGIAQEMRTLFSVVGEAVKQGKNPLTAVEKYKKQQAVSGKTKAIWSNVQGFAGKTLETIMEAFFKANIK